METSAAMRVRFAAIMTWRLRQPSTHAPAGSRQEECERLQAGKQSDLRFAGVQDG